MKTPMFVQYTYFTVLTFFIINGGHATLDQTKSFSADIASLLPSSTCKSSASTGPNGEATLSVVDRNGACFLKGKQITIALAQILRQDRSRVDSIQSRSFNKNQITEKKTTLPSQTGASFGTGNFIVTVGLGTPRKNYSLIFDTGSDLTWTQCSPCIDHCYPQKDPVFNPAKSKSYSSVACKTPLCDLLIPATGKVPGCYGSTCVYSILYGDQSFSIGFLAKESIALGPDVFTNFLFGCGQNNDGLFGRADGLLGLGRSKISLVSQTAAKYGRVFSYCLPTRASGTNGYLTFGKGGILTKKVKYTPLLRPGDGYYSVDILGISVGGKLVPISASVFQTTGTIVDSGTVITRLPLVAYTALRNAFKQQMKKYKSAPAFSFLDTCYDFTGLKTIILPKVSFVFRGNATLELGLNGIFVAASQAQFCLAFAGNSNPYDLGILGNTQQQSQQVVYDVAAGKLGFAAGGCS